MTQIPLRTLEKLEWFIATSNAVGGGPQAVRAGSTLEAFVLWRSRFWRHIPPHQRHFGVVVSMMPPAGIEPGVCEWPDDLTETFRVDFHSLTTMALEAVHGVESSNPLLEQSRETTE